VEERIKVKVKSKGKMRTVVKTLTKYVTQDFAWKDPIAAQKAKMSLKDYVIGGMDPGFRRKLYDALRAMDDAGFSPGITSGFRDDYRQELVSGNKAASDSSYHGGSRRGGYGHGLAADLPNCNNPRSARAGADTSNSATGTVRNKAVVDTHIREAPSFGMATDKWDPHRKYECGE
jgi:hypothetical protein